MKPITVIAEPKIPRWALEREIINAGLDSSLVEFVPSIPSEQSTIIMPCNEKAKHFLPDTNIEDQHGYVTMLNSSFIIPIRYAGCFVGDAAFWIKIAFIKAKELLEFPSKYFEPNNLLINPNLHQVESFFSNLHGLMSCDIEKTQTNEISAIAFAKNKNEAMSIPFIVAGGSYWSKQDERTIWTLINDKLRDTSSEIIFQNHIFDVLTMSYFGIEVNENIHDTMIQAHLLHPELPKGLADIARIHTYGKEWKSKGEWKNIKDWPTFWTYNALDTTKTLECFESQKAIIDKKGLSGLYEHLRKLIKPVYQMCATGWNLDLPEIEKEKIRVEAETEGLKKEIVEYANKVGMNSLNPASSKQLKEFAVAMGWEIPKKKAAESMDASARAKLYLKYKHPILPLLDRCKELQKYKSSYLNATLDTDGKYRFSIIIPGTVEARFSSSQTPMKTGGNSQNIPKEFRRFVIPDKKGYILVNTDLDRADAQVVAWLAKEQTMTRILESGADMHVITANSIFGKDITTLPKEEMLRSRQVGKTANHALNYGMGPKKFKDNLLLKTGISITETESADVIKKYFLTYPQLRIWHQAIQSQIKQTRTLTSPHGRTRIFLGIMDDKMFREAYSWIPPTTVADSINTSMLIFIENCNNATIDFRVLGQKHDSFLYQVKESDLAASVECLNDAMKRSVFYIHGKPCCIPHGVEVGPNWGEMKLYKGEK